MKWGYDTFAQQPAWFLDTLSTVMNLDAEYQNRQAKIAERRARRK